MDNPKALGVPAKAIKGIRVSYGAVQFVWRAIISLFGQIMGLFCVLLNVEAESREIGGDRRLGGRAFVQALESVIELFEIVILRYSRRSASRASRRIGGFFATRNQSMFGFFFKVPFRSETREIEFALRLLVCCLFSRAPKCFEFVWAVSRHCGI